MKIYKNSISINKEELSEMRETPKMSVDFQKHVKIELIVSVLKELSLTELNQVAFFEEQTLTDWYGHESTSFSIELKLY